MRKCWIDSLVEGLHVPQVRRKLHSFRQAQNQATADDRQESKQHERYGNARNGALSRTVITFPIIRTSLVKVLFHAATYSNI